MSRKISRRVSICRISGVASLCSRSTRIPCSVNGNRDFEPNFRQSTFRWTGPLDQLFGQLHSLSFLLTRPPEKAASCRRRSIPSEEARPVASRLWGQPLLPRSKALASARKPMGTARPMEPLGVGSEHPTSPRKAEEATASPPAWAGWAGWGAYRPAGSLNIIILGFASLSRENLRKVPAGRYDSLNLWDR